MGEDQTTKNTKSTKGLGRLAASTTDDILKSAENVYMPAAREVKKFVCSNGTEATLTDYGVIRVMAA